MFLSVKQVVERLNGSVSKTVVYDEIRRGLLRSSRVGGKIIVAESDLREYLGRGHEKAPPEPEPVERGKGVRHAQIDLW